MTGKKVEASMNVYMTGINPKEIFMKAEQALTLIQVTNNNHAAIEELKDENRNLKVQLDSVTERLAKWEKDVEEFKQMRKELEDNVKIVKEGGLVIAYTGEETKEQMIEFIRKNLQKEK